MSESANLIISASQFVRHLFFIPIILQLLHTISGWLIIVAFAAKILLHFWLDKQQQPSLGLLAILFIPSIYFGKYKAAVVAKYQTHNCNVIAAGLFQVRLWRYTISIKNNLHAALPKGIAKYKTAIPLIVVGYFILSLIIHVTIGGIAATLFLSSLFIITITVERFFKKKYQLGKRY